MSVGQSLIERILEPVPNPMQLKIECITPLYESRKLLTGDVQVYVEKENVQPGQSGWDLWGNGLTSADGKKKCDARWVAPANPESSSLPLHTNVWELMGYLGAVGFYNQELCALEPIETKQRVKYVAFWGRLAHFKFSLHLIRCEPMRQSYRLRLERSQRLLQFPPIKNDAEPGY